jgi:hypothetical protein
MLRLKPNPTFKAPVTIPVPGGPDLTITVEYKHMTKDAYKAFIDGERKTVPARPDEDAIMDIASGWSDVELEEGPAAFNKDNVRDLCQQYHGAGAAIVEVFVNELTQYRRGNS